MRYALANFVVTAYILHIHDHKRLPGLVALDEGARLVMGSVIFLQPKEIGILTSFSSCREKKEPANSVLIVTLQGYQ